MGEYKLEVMPEEAGRRLDLFLMDFFRNNGLAFSRTFIQGLIASGQVTSKDGIVPKPHYKVKSKEAFKVVIEDKKPAEVFAENIPVEVLYEDADVAVVDKPAGLVVHPAPGHAEHTLVNALLYRFKDLSSVNPKRPGIVHRLDRDTSGLLLVARNNFAHQALAKQFEEHSIKRKYIAVVEGKMEFDENVVEIPIGRDVHKRESMSVGFGGNTRYAKTYYRTLKRTDTFSLLELEPFTGRTHQLRVHMAFLGHPISGDIKYGKTKAGSRLALHARYIGFIHPRTEKFMEFSSEVPRELLALVGESQKRGQNHFSF